MTKKISDRQAICNSVIVNCIFAYMDYNAGKISEDTLKYVFKQQLSISHLFADKQSKEFRSHPTIAFLMQNYR